jgi:hypothetical protein
LEIVRVILVIGVLAAALGLAFEALLPASASLIAIAAAVSGIATWIVSLLLVAVGSIQKPKSPFWGASFLIRIVLVASCLSAIGLAFALVTFLFADGTGPAWIAVLAVASFWLAGFGFVAIVDRHARRRESPVKINSPPA